MSSRWDGLREPPGGDGRAGAAHPEREVVVPYFWVRGARPADIESAFEAHRGVAGVDLVDDVDDEYMMRAEWDDDYYGVLNALAHANIAVLSGAGTRDGWRFEVRGEDREAIGEFRTDCQDRDIDIGITAVHSLLPVQGDGYDLTETQREALVLA
nr:bacterio-opsin activator domain-containing protein [Halorubrum sp. Ea8]